MADNIFDYKKEYKHLYMPKAVPALIEVPDMNFMMIDGKGDPNSPAFEQAVEVLYALSYTIKMSVKKGNQPEGYFEYVVPPLEGLWWLDSGDFSFAHRANWVWTIMIRQPQFVNLGVFNWAKVETGKKKPELKLGDARFESFTEGLCVQSMHIGPYATEPETMLMIQEFMDREGLTDLVGSRGGKHHEIYLSDPRKAKPESMKTVLRHPVSKQG